MVSLSRVESGMAELARRTGKGGEQAQGAVGQEW